MRLIRRLIWKSSLLLQATFIARVRKRRITCTRKSRAVDLCRLDSSSSSRKIPLWIIISNMVSTWAVKLLFKPVAQETHVTATQAWTSSQTKYARDRRMLRTRFKTHTMSTPITQPTDTETKTDKAAWTTTTNTRAQSLVATEPIQPGTPITTSTITSIKATTHLQLQTRWEWETTLWAETPFTWVITNYKSKVVSLIISQWAEGNKSSITIRKIKIWTNNKIMHPRKFQLLKIAIIWIKTKVLILWNRGLYLGKLMLTFGLKFTKTKESCTIFSKTSKKIWTWCSTILTILVIRQVRQMVGDQQQVTMASDP